MSAKEQITCGVCHKRPAIHFTCYGNTGASRHLCMTCFEQTASPDELESFRHSEQVICNGKCQYCGAPAAGGSMSPGIPGVMDEKADLWCELCRRDLVEFASRPENAIPDVFDVEIEARLEQISQQLDERRRREREFMRQKVGERHRNDAS